MKRAIRYGLAGGVPALLAFAALAIFSRLLSADQYGLYATIVATVAVANAILFQWLRSGVRRYAPAGGYSDPVFLSTTRSLFLRLGAVVIIAGALAALILPVGLVALGTLLLLLQAWHELSLELSLARLDPVRYGLVASLRAVIWLAVSIGGVLAGWGGVGVIIGLLAGYGTTGVMLLLREWRLASGRPDPVVALQFRTYGIPLTAAFLLQFIVYSSDRLLLAKLATTAAVGVYAVSYDLAMQPLTFLMMTVNLSAFPTAAKALDTSGVNEARRHLATQGVLHACLALPSAIGITLLAPSIAAVVLGSEFQEGAVAIIPWVAAGGLLSGFKSYYFDLAFQLGESTGMQLIPVGIAAGLNVGLNIWLIPHYGAMGAAYSTLVAFAIGLIFSIVVGRRRFRMPLPLGEWARVAFAAAVMAVVVRSCGQTHTVPGLAWRVALGAATFGAVAFVLDVLGVRGRFRERMAGRTLT